MPFNILKALKNRYGGRENVPVYSVLMEAIHGTPEEQYNAFAWYGIGTKPTLQELESNWLAEAIAECTAALNKYAAEKADNYTILYNNNEYKACGIDRSNVQHFATADDVQREYWKADGTSILLTKADFIAMNIICAKLLEDHNKKLQEYIAQIKNATDPDTIDYTKEWPVNPYQVSAPSKSASFSAAPIKKSPPPKESFFKKIFKWGGK